MRHLLFFLFLLLLLINGVLLWKNRKADSGDRNGCCALFNPVKLELPMVNVSFFPVGAGLTP